MLVPFNYLSAGVCLNGPSGEHQPWGAQGLRQWPGDPWRDSERLPGVSSPMDLALVPEPGLHRGHRQQLKGGPRGDGWTGGLPSLAFWRTKGVDWETWKLLVSWTQVGPLYNIPLDNPEGERVGLDNGAQRVPGIFGCLGNPMCIVSRTFCFWCLNFVMCGEILSHQPPVLAGWETWLPGVPNTR